MVFGDRHSILNEPQRSRFTRRSSIFRQTLAATILFAGLAPVLQAADVWHRSTLKAIYPLADGNYILSFTSDAPGCTSTNSPKYHYVFVNENGISEEASKKIYAASLLAYSLGQSVSIVYNDTTSSCFINRLYLSNRAASPSDPRNRAARSSLAVDSRSPGNRKLASPKSTRRMTL